MQVRPTEFRSIIVLVLLLGCEQDSYEASPEEHEACELLALAVPVDVVDVGEYLDGGTVHFVLRGARKTELLVCFDRRIGAPAPQSIYVGAQHPDAQGARRLELGGPEDCAVSLLVRAWLERVFSTEELHEALETRRAYGPQSREHRNAGTLLLRLDARHQALALYSDDEACAAVLGLRAPVEVTEIVASHATGGPVGFVLKDGFAKEFRAYFDRMLRGRTRRIVIGTIAPPYVDDPANGERQVAILGLLNRWCQRNPPGTDGALQGNHVLCRRLESYQYPVLLRGSETPN